MNFCLVPFGFDVWRSLTFVRYFAREANDETVRWKRTGMSIGSKKMIIPRRMFRLSETILRRLFAENISRPHPFSWHLEIADVLSSSRRYRFHGKER